ncbi:coiled-coil domain-containing protein 33-like [Amphiura filiformis]|uniref:coiled-coil domain-containing protein 33-like n=1 Tax=Amphiura filiformis TaxID=82378 RepID=UPI003B20D34F
MKSSQLPRIGAFGFQGLEVMLIAMEESLSNPVGPLTAVARVVPDFFNYVQSISKQQESSALKSLSIQWPTPHPSSFSTLPSQSQFGHPQWTLPGLPENRPVWNHTFMFCDKGEVASMFNDTSALVIELYPTNATFNGNNWSLPQCCGYCSLLLDARVREALMSDRGSMGVRVEHVSLQLTELCNRDNRTPSVELVLRLPTTVEPDLMVSVSDIDALPSLETFHRSKFPPDDLPLFTRIDWSSIMTPPPVASQPSNMKNVPKHKAINEVEAPSHSAIENILKLAKQPSPGNSSHSNHSGLIPTRLPPKSLQNGHHSSTPPASSTHSDKHALSLLDSQQKEINSYKDALKRMGEDIVRLQEDVARLEMENSQLRQRINMHEDATKAMVDVKELDDLARADLIDKYVTLTRKLASQVEETSGYREKLVRMQNNMIKQNDREQQYLKQRDNLLKQQDELQNKQEKIKKLERTCVEQEKALEKMERILRNKLKNNKSEENYKADDVNVLAVENARLRSQIEQYRKTPPGQAGSSEDADKLRLQLQLEKAKGRVASLERELMEKAREWGKEKEVMRLRVGDRHDNHRNRSLPPLHRDRGYSYNLVSKRR